MLQAIAPAAPKALKATAPAPAASAAAPTSRAMAADGVAFQPRPVQVPAPKAQAAKGKFAEKVLLTLGYSSMAALCLGFPALSLNPVVGGAMIIGGSVGTVLCGFGLLINHARSQR